jgi:hypothetical protein
MENKFVHILKNGSKKIGMKKSIIDQPPCFLLVGPAHYGHASPMLSLDSARFQPVIAEAEGQGQAAPLACGGLCVLDSLAGTAATALPEHVQACRPPVRPVRSRRHRPAQQWPLQSACSAAGILIGQSCTKERRRREASRRCRPVS